MVIWGKMKNLKPIARKSELVVQESGDETLVYDLRTNKASCLNQTSALVWRHCDGEKTVGDIATWLEAATDAQVTDDLVWLAIDQLKQEDLIDNGDEIVSNFEGMSRREVIRKVGLASMIVLPGVASLVAPTAVMAQSLAGGTAPIASTTGTCANSTGRPNGCACSSSDQCYNNSCKTPTKQSPTGFICDL